MKTKKKIFKLLKTVFLIIGFSLFIFSFLQLLKGDFFRIKQVVCFENSSSCQSDLWLKVNSLTLGKNIIFLSPQKITQEIDNQLPTIGSVKVEKKLPNKLIVRLDKRKPIAAIETGSEYWLTDYQGIILEKLDQPADLPLIIGGGSNISSDNQRVESSSILASLDYLYKLLFNSIEAYRVEIINSSELAVYLRTGPKVLVSVENSHQQQVDSLQLVLTRTKIEGRKIKEIDLRFDKPVIIFFDE